MTRVFWTLALLTLIPACTATAPPRADPAISIRLANAGPRPMRCEIMFGHWVDRDLGIVQPGAVTGFIAQQQADGALYIERADGQRRLMIENVFCGAENNWQATVGEIDLARARVMRPHAVEARCVLPIGGRVNCAPPVLKP